MYWLGKTEAYLIGKKRESEKVHYTPLEAVLETVREALDKSAPLGGKYDIQKVNDELTVERCKLFPSQSIYLEWERGWAIGITIRLHIKREDDSRVTTDGKAFDTWKAWITISWPSSEYNLAGALTTNVLHTEVIDFAALLSSIVEDRFIGDIREISENL